MMMANDAERLLRLAGDVAALRQQVDDLRATIALLYGNRSVPGADVVQASNASVVVSDAVGGLSKRIEEELRRARTSRNIVFVVDHEEHSRGLATEALSSAGFAVQSFQRADDLIEILPLAVPKAVLIDLEIPGMPGTVLAEYLRTNPRTARVRRLGMTGFVPSPTEARPFTSLIEKPLEPVSLVDFVRHALARVPTRPPPGQL
jgi:CheY-like chemotaxis protein